MSDRFDVIAPWCILAALTVAVVVAAIEREWLAAACIVYGWCARSAFR
jgi:hypothetical protein